MQPTKLDIEQSVKEYYGEVLHSSSDLKTNACVTGGRPPQYIRNILSLIHDEVASKYYGCGLVAPEALDGAYVLDLGSGSGRDCYMLSKIVGEKGKVVGVDMTPKLLEVANKYIAYHTEKFGFSLPNVEFKLGNIQKLDEVGLQDNFFDVIISNCVLNLCSDKEAVLRQAYRVLKQGGEFYFSDVYADRRLPQSLVNDPVLYGECISGALYWNDFINLAKKVGFQDPRLVSDSVITIRNEAIESRLGGYHFYSATFRLFKLHGLEPACEDYGQAVIYKGTLEEHPEIFAFDKHHIFPKGKVIPVCGNTYRMLKDTRLAPHFDFIGTWETHYGIFEGCGIGSPFTTSSATTKSSSGCCS